MKRIYSSRKSLMVSEEDEDSAVKCRERRHRRMAMRRMQVSSGSLETKKCAALNKNENLSSSSTAAAAAIMSLISIMETPPAPAYGMMSVIGRKREMEDEVSVKTNLCRPEINGFRPVHFFAVFDGHGGSHVSRVCRENMHAIMEEELMRVGDDSNGSGEAWRRAIKQSFQRMDEMALRLCLCGGSEICRCNPKVSFMGSTAVVSLLTKDYIFVANCGDSRAVLCRGGRPVPLSLDHKPDREDERTRIEACGGRIMFSDGPRVEGILSMSRAIGDRLLKQWVTSEPEISITKREEGDECLILGSDGVWDVLSSELACKVVHECLAQNENPNASAQGDTGYSSRSDSAATLLVRLALGRRSSDNISVIVIDLSN